MGSTSTASSRSLALKDVGLVAAAASIAVAAYLVVSARTYRLGFPLDDSWIHATYARNLALHHEWAFQLGQRSAGSTAPLWTALLVPGYWLGIAPLWWTYLMGLAALVLLGLAAELAVRHLAASYRPGLPWIALLLVIEWHMVWSASSGMETALYAALATVVLSLLITGSNNYAALGLGTGLALWTRPDGLTLAGPVLVVLLLARQERVRRLRAVASYLLGFGALLLPYLLLNLWLSGTPMPNTFYAKQAEYAAWQARPVFYRMGIGLGQLFLGPLLLLTPGLVLAGIRTIRTRNIPMAAAFVWCMLYALMYIMRLPAYQHGRYLMPVMPMLLVLGILGYIDFRESNWGGRYHWVAAWTWQSGLLLLSLGFWWLGARGYGQDVAVIESEMVDTAYWVAENVPPDGVIAAHDIGALGYFDHHELIDLAGLVSPEVVPFIRDEARLAEFLDARGATILIAFPGLYPHLAALSQVVHSTKGEYAPTAGVGNMTVYCWRCY